ncbi:MAG: DUF1588 domain-containing protein, partial [Akkermansiaceae bacterium]
GVSHYRAMFDATASSDRLIELILEEDQEVLKELLTTQKVVATKNDEKYFGTLRSKEERDTAAAEQRMADRVAKKEASAELEVLKKQLAALDEKIKATKDGRTKKGLDREKKQLEGARKKAQNIVKKGLGNRGNPAVNEVKLSGPKIFARVSHRSFGSGSMKPDRTLATVPEGERMGILTHPSWLVSHSDAMDNHAILRGRWIRERLLGGGIPDVPITVDAMLPDEPNTTLRSRMRLTRETYCWTCHKKMDPLGLPFEMYNHAGLLRTTELGKPVDTSGAIIDSGDSKLDGPVTNALDLIKKLSESERVEQVFVRHAFRYWMGRNETLNDAPVLQEAHHAYRKSGGSMKALILSLVTSDAFLYRE